MCSLYIEKMNKIVYTEFTKIQESRCRKMARYKEKEKPKHIKRVSLFSFLFPLLFLLYAESVFGFFSDMRMTVYKILFSLSLGCVAIVFSALTPWRAVNYILQTVYTLFCIGFVTVQYLCFRVSGTYFALFSGADPLPDAALLLSYAENELPFLFLMAVPVLLQLTVQGVVSFRRECALSVLLGGRIMVLFGTLLLALILSFVSVSLAFKNDADTVSPRKQLEKEYMPVASAEAFGVLPQAVLDLKFNVLHIKEEDIVHHYIVTENGEYVELSEEELEEWNREG